MNFIIEKKRLTRWCKFWIILTVFLLSTTATCLADDQSNSLEKRFDIQELQGAIPDIQGILNGVYKNRIVVDDRNLQLQFGANTVGFQKGEYVGVKLNSKGEVELIVRPQPSD
jgi:hypothetical protein